VRLSRQVTVFRRKLRSGTLFRLVDQRQIYSGTSRSQRNQHKQSFDDLNGYRLYHAGAV